MKTAPDTAIQKPACEAQMGCHIPVLLKAIEVLDALEGGQGIRLEKLYSDLRIPKSTAFRILSTLVHRGYVVRTEDGGYVSKMETPKKSKICVVLGIEEDNFRFEVAAAASRVGVSVRFRLLDPDPAEARSLAHSIAVERPDAVVLFHCSQYPTLFIVDILHSLHIPLIAVDIPHSHAVYFGVDDYRLGFAAGEILAARAIGLPPGSQNLLLGLDPRTQEESCHPRITGAKDAFVSLVGSKIDCRTLRVACGEEEHVLRRAVFSSLGSDTERGNIFVFAATPGASLQALAAARQLRKVGSFNIVGCLAPDQALEKFKQGESLIGCVWPRYEDYGATLIQLALRLVGGATTAPYNYMSHNSLIMSADVPNETHSRRIAAPVLPNMVGNAARRSSAADAI